MGDCAVSPLGLYLLGWASVPGAYLMGVWGSRVQGFMV